MDIQLPDIYNVLIRRLFATAVRERAKAPQVGREQPELSNVFPVYSMVQRYLANRFRNSSGIELVRYRAPAQHISSKQGVRDQGNKYLGYRGER